MCDESSYGRKDAEQEVGEEYVLSQNEESEERDEDIQEGAITEEVEEVALVSDQNQQETRDEDYDEKDDEKNDEDVEENGGNRYNEDQDEKDDEKNDEEVEVNGGNRYVVVEDEIIPTCLKEDHYVFKHGDLTNLDEDVFENLSAEMDTTMDDLPDPSVDIFITLRRDSEVVRKLHTAMIVKDQAS